MQGSTRSMSSATARGGLEEEGKGKRRLRRLRPTSPQPPIYHERQSPLRMMCGLCAINNLCGQKIVTKKRMDRIADQLWEEECALIRKGGGKKKGLNPYRSFLPFMGFYDLSVMTRALAEAQCRITKHIRGNPSFPNKAREDLEQLNLDSALGVLVHRSGGGKWSLDSGHWYALVPQRQGGAKHGEQGGAGAGAAAAAAAAAAAQAASGICPHHLAGKEEVKEEAQNNLGCEECAIAAAVAAVAAAEAAEAAAKAAEAAARAPVVWWNVDSKIRRPLILRPWSALVASLLAEVQVNDSQIFVVEREVGGSVGHVHSSHSSCSSTVPCSESVEFAVAAAASAASHEMENARRDWEEKAQACPPGAAAGAEAASVNHAEGGGLTSHRNACHVKD